MTRHEKDDIERLPEKYRPLGAWGYLGYTILFNIPLIGFIAWLICALSGSNVNRRSYARMYFCAFLLVFIIAAVALVILLATTGAFKGGFSLTTIVDTIKQYIINFYQQIRGNSAFLYY